MQKQLPIIQENVFDYPWLEIKKHMYIKLYGLQAPSKKLFAVDLYRGSKYLLGALGMICLGATLPRVLTSTPPPKNVERGSTKRPGSRGTLWRFATWRIQLPPPRIAFGADRVEPPYSELQRGGHRGGGSEAGEIRDVGRQL